MKWQHVRAMARKEWRHLFRDPGSLALMLLMPTMLLFLFGYAIRLDVTEAPLGVLQYSSDAESDRVVAHFEASNAFAVAEHLRSRRELEQAIQQGRIWAALVIPADFARDLARGEATLQLVTDGIDANSARLVRNYAQVIVNDFVLRGEGERLIRIEDRLWFNEARESRIAIVPGVISIVMAVIGALMTSLTIAREMESGNLVMLRTTSLTRGEFLVGKLGPYFIIGMVDLAVALVAAVFVFDVPLRGPLTALLVVSAVFLLVVMLQGAFISISAGNQMLASQVALVSTFLPAFLLSGFIFAIENMPVALQYITLVVPARYFVTLSKAIFLKGVSPLLLWGQMTALFVIFVLLALATYRRAKKLGLLS